MDSARVVRQPAVIVDGANTTAASSLPIVRVGAPSGLNPSDLTLSGAPNEALPGYCQG